METISLSEEIMPWKMCAKVSANFKMRHIMLVFFYFPQQLKEYLGSEVSQSSER